MPFAFPPSPKDVPTIEAAVETAKADLRFNEKLCDHLLAVISRFGFGNGLPIARALLPPFISGVINPQIQKIVVAPNQDPESHPHYQQRSPREFGRNIKRYDNVTLFQARSEFEDDAKAICVRIYTDPTALALKPVAILNLLHWGFYTQCAYFTDPTKQAELQDAWRRLETAT